MAFDKIEMRNWMKEAWQQYFCAIADTLKMYTITCFCTWMKSSTMSSNYVVSCKWFVILTEMKLNPFGFTTLFISDFSDFLLNVFSDFSPINYVFRGDAAFSFLQQISWPIYVSLMLTGLTQVKRKTVKLLVEVLQLVKLLAQQRVLPHGTQFH